MLLIMSNKNIFWFDKIKCFDAIWLDKGEWALIKAEGLAGSLNKIFTAPLQRNIKEQNAHDVLDASYRNQLGDEDYEKLKEIRT
jgi:hypothetical protein